MPVPWRRLPTGTIIVDMPEPATCERVVLYARVSSHDQRAISTVNLRAFRSMPPNGISTSWNRCLRSVPGSTASVAK